LPVLKDIRGAKIPADTHDPGAIMALKTILAACFISLVAASTVIAAPISTLTKTPTVNILNEDRVDFAWTYSTVPDSLRIDFGDGQAKSFPAATTSARHFFRSAGRYDVVVTTWKNGAAEQLTFPNFVVVGQRPLPGTNMMFVHHSTGRNLIRDSGVRSLLESHNTRYGTGMKFWDHDYHSGNSFTGIIKPDSTVHSNWSYGEEANDIQPDGWHTVFCTDSAFMDSLLNRHDIIILKNDHSTGDITSDTMLQTYQSQYLQIRSVLDQYPDKLFVLVSGSPRRPEDTTNAMADRSRTFYNWLQSPGFMNGHPNVVFFDLFDELAAPNTASNPARNMLRPEYRRPDAPSDSHPNTFANVTIGPRFAAMLIRMVDPDWIGELTAAPAAPPAPLLLAVGNHPNPFNPSTAIEFTLTQPAPVSLDVFDLSGRLIRRILGPVRLVAGPHTAHWDGTDDQGRSQPSGVYLFRVDGGPESVSRRMLLVR
jgi:hypothetical protein